MRNGALAPRVKKGTLISVGEITHQELHAIPVVCFDFGFGKINLSDSL
jgi:hypothetical protein